MADPNPKIISYTQLSLLIGLSAIFLAIICILGGMIWGKVGVQSSISAYYYTNMRDLLEAVLMGVGAFCLCFYGVSNYEHTAYAFTGLFCTLIGVFPCQGADPKQLVGIFRLPAFYSSIFHGISAILFFIMGVIISFRIFPKDAKYSSLYKVCGSGILVSICVRIFQSLIGVNGANAAKAANGIPWVLIVEALMLAVFGIMWIIHSLEALSKTQNKKVAGNSTLPA